jgi:hypothetical protein
MFYFFLAVMAVSLGTLLYLVYRDQKQEKNSYRTNVFHICRIEVLEERDFLSASPLGDFYNDDNDYDEPPYNPSDTYIEYNAYSNAVAQQNEDHNEEYPGDNYTSLFNSGNYSLADNAADSDVETQVAQQTSISLTRTKSTSLCDFAETSDVARPIPRAT